MIAIERLADVFVDVADTLVTDFDLIDFLHTVARPRCRGHRHRRGRADAGRQRRSAALHGRLETRARKVLELLQLQNAEGPCLECFHSGEAVAEADLRAAYDRWPVFAPRAVGSGCLRCTRSRCACGTR